MAYEFHWSCSDREQKHETIVGGKVLFVGTNKGTIRAYKLPLSEEFQELHCSSTPIVHLTLSQDHNTLFAANSLGVVFVFAVKDKDPSRGSMTDKRDDQLPFSIEVLLSKASLEEKNQRIVELEAQVSLSYVYWNVIDMILGIWNKFATAKIRGIWL